MHRLLSSPRARPSSPREGRQCHRDLVLRGGGINELSREMRIPVPRGDMRRRHTLIGWEVIASYQINGVLCKLEHARDRHAIVWVLVQASRMLDVEASWVERLGRFALLREVCMIFQGEQTLVGGRFRLNTLHLRSILEDTWQFPPCCDGSKRKGEKSGCLFF